MSGRLPNMGHVKHLNGHKIGQVQHRKSDTSHLAIGLVVATGMVLLLPSLGRQRHKIQERDILRAHGVIMSSLALM
jgi:hypothetical protein